MVTILQRSSSGVELKFSLENGKLLYYEKIVSLHRTWFAIWLLHLSKYIFDIAEHTWCYFAKLNKVLRLMNVKVVLLLCLSSCQLSAAFFSRGQTEGTPPPIFGTTKVSVLCFQSRFAVSLFCVYFFTSNDFLFTHFSSQKDLRRHISCHFSTPTQFSTQLCHFSLQTDFRQHRLLLLSSVLIGLK